MQENSAKRLSFGIKVDALADKFTNIVGGGEAHGASAGDYGIREFTCFGVGGGQGV